MEKNLEINKLADIVAWADSIIRAGGYNEEKYKSDAATAYCHVKAHELWRIRDVALKSMERHTVYTNALNKDIADKAAKIEKLEKEIEGRKEGYTALKELMDTKYISIDEHKKEIEEITKSRDIWFETAGTHSATILHNSEEIDKLKEEIKKLNKCIMNKNESINTANDAIVNLHKEISAHEEENARLSKKITELKKANGNCAVRVGNLERELEKTCNTKELDLKGHNRREMALVDELADKNDEIKSLKEENSYLKSELKQKQNIIKKAYERYSDEILKTRKDLMEVAYRDIEKDNGYIGFKLYVENTLIEAKGNKEEANEVITNAVKFFYREWDKEQKENEKTIEKAINEVKSKRGTPDIPCGEDAIE